MGKLVSCKMCGKDQLYWGKDLNHKWCLQDDQGARHTCEGKETKQVTCKDCGANDLHWYQNKMDDGTLKWSLTESFGLPHACDERRKKLDDAKQALKDIYNKEKARLAAIPSGSNCPNCHSGVVPGLQMLNAPRMRCVTCDGVGKMSESVKKHILYRLRKQLWPRMFNR